MPFKVKYIEYPVSKEGTAYHEAGHAVTDFLMGYIIKSISLNQVKGSLGRTKSTLNILPTTLLEPLSKYKKGDKRKYIFPYQIFLRNKLNMLCFQLLAGYIAQFKFLKLDLPTDIISNKGYDYYLMRTEITKANQLVGYDFFTDSDFHRINLKTRKEIRKKKNWECIKEIAAAAIASKRGLITKKEIHSILTKHLKPYTDEELSLIFNGYVVTVFERHQIIVPFIQKLIDEGAITISSSGAITISSSGGLPCSSTR